MTDSESQFHCTVIRDGRVGDEEPEFNWVSVQYSPDLLQLQFLLFIKKRSLENIGFVFNSKVEKVYEFQLGNYNAFILSQTADSLIITVPPEVIESQAIISWDILIPCAITSRAAREMRRHRSNCLQVHVSQYGTIAEMQAALNRFILYHTRPLQGKGNAMTIIVII